MFFKTPTASFCPKKADSNVTILNLPDLFNKLNTAQAIPLEPQRKACLTVSVHLAYIVVGALSF